MAAEEEGAVAAVGAVEEEGEGVVVAAGVAMVAVEEPTPFTCNPTGQPRRGILGLAPL